MQIRNYEPRDREAVVRLSLRAWAPVFISIQQAMDADLYQEFYPDWRVSQQQAVEEVCADDKYSVWVTEEGGAVAGFVAVTLRSKELGEIYMIAVAPDFQRQGIGRALTNFALAWMKQSGIRVAMVETGADPGHAPARRTYEQCGFSLLPAARYFKKL